MATRGSIAAAGKSLLVRQLSAVDDSLKADPGVSKPTSTRRISHAALEGAALTGSLTLPSDFNLYFGAPLNQQPRTALPGYADRVPTVLVILARDMVARKGLLIEGIFRVTPEMASLKTTKDALNRGDGLLSNVDPVVSAGLIKDFFRSLPEALLASVPPTVLAELGDASTAGVDAKWNQLLFGSVLSEPQRSTFVWILDLMSLVLEEGATNRMSPSALGVVFAPSLYFTKDMDMSAMNRTKDVQSIVQGALEFVMRSPSARKPLSP